MNKSKLIKYIKGIKIVSELDTYFLYKDDVISFKKFNWDYNTMTIQKPVNYKKTIKINEEDILVVGNDTITANGFSNLCLISKGEIVTPIDYVYVPTDSDCILQSYLSCSKDKEIVTIKDKKYYKFKLNFDCLLDTLPDSITVTSLSEYLACNHLSKLASKLIESKQYKKESVYSLSNTFIEIYKKYNVDSKGNLITEYSKSEPKGNEFNRFYFKGFTSLPSIDAIKKDIEKGKTNYFINTVKNWITNYNEKELETIQNDIIESEYMLMLYRISNVFDVVSEDDIMDTKYGTIIITKEVL